MKKSSRYLLNSLKTLATCSLFILCTNAFSETTSNVVAKKTLPVTTTKPVSAEVLTPAVVPVPVNPVVERSKRENAASANTFAIAFHRPTYILPYYYTGTTYNRIYKNETPNSETLKHNELKFQLSFKVPIWKNILNFPSTFYLGYTQMSYWQAYDKDPFFRSTDYEPELFIANELNWHLLNNWQLNFFNVGAVHQSNGFGGSLERSWNRMYVSAVASSDHLILVVKPWIIMRDNAYQRQNPDMAKYMGYGQIVVAWKYNNQVFSLETRNLIESGGRRSGTSLSWSFPMTKYLKGYMQVFSGYGQSLIEYNHRTTSAGVGIALSNWV
jgi:phospholipase A1